MTWRSLTIVTAFLAVAGIVYAQDVPGISAGGTLVGGFEQRNAPEPAISGTDSAVSNAPLGGIERRDVFAAQSGALHYTISANQSFQTNAVSNRNGTPETTGASGTLAFASNSARNQLGTTYSGGGSWSSQATASNLIFQNFEVKDTLRLKRFTLMVLNDVNYSPQSPIGGGSGIPGVGDLSGSLGFGTISPTIAPDQTILTQESQRISNATAGSVMINLTGQTSVTALGSYSILRFLDTDGYDSHQKMAGLTVNHRFSARDTVGVKYTFTGLGYDDMPIILDTHEVSVIYERLWSRRWMSNFEVGPQWGESTQMSSVPNHTDIAGIASITYNHSSVTSADLHYTRGVGGGSGVIFGARVDTVAMAMTHSFGRTWSASFSGTYSRNAGILQNNLFTSKSAGAQLTRKLTRDSSCYFSYTAVAQSSSGASFVEPVSVLHGLYHTFGFGIQFASRPIRMRGV